MRNAWSIPIGTMPFFAALAVAGPGCAGSDHARKAQLDNLERRVTRLQEERQQDGRPLQELRRHTVASAGWQKQMIEALERQHRALARLQRQVAALSQLQHSRCIEIAEQHGRLTRKFSEVSEKVKRLRKKIESTKTGRRRRTLSRTLAPLSLQLERVRAEVDIHGALARACRPFMPGGLSTRPAAVGSPPPEPPPPLPGAEPPSRPGPRSRPPARKPPDTGA